MSNELQKFRIEIAKLMLQSGVTAEDVAQFRAEDATRFREQLTLSKKTKLPSRGKQGMSTRAFTFFC